MPSDESTCIQFQCDACGKALQAPSTSAGKRVKCPKCGKRLAVPGEPSAAEGGPSAERPEAGRSPVVPAEADSQPAVDAKQQDVPASDVPTLVPPKETPPARGSRQPPDDGDSTLTPAQVESLWGSSLTQDLTPAMTIKARPHTQPKPSRLNIREKHLAESGKREAGADYDLLEVLGKGGMGVVYAARQASVDRLIALKMLLPKLSANAEAQAKFLAEAAVTGDLDHPNIVPLYDLGSDEAGKLFYAMKLVKGTPWSKVLAGKPLRENLGILQRVADAVAFAHSRGVVHRDLKPENVMLGEYGEVLLMDWGLAVSVTPQGKAERLTKEAACAGTPAYISPEMALGKVEQIGPASDVYLLGAILYELVAGKPPHHAPTALACLVSAARNQIQPTETKGELLDIALKAMATKPADRYGSVKEFQGALQEYRGHSDSLALSMLAQQGLEQASRSRDYADFARAMFSFEEALKLWPGNRGALAGAKTARVAYAACAFEKGDLDLAGSLLEAEGLQATPLARRVQAAREERAARARRLKALTWASAGLAAAVLIAVSVGFYMVRAEQAATALQRDKAVEAQAAEAEQRRKAEENERKALAAAAAEKKAKETAEARQAETEAVLGFVQDRVFAAARPEGQEGGLGREVTLRRAIEAALPFVEKSFRDQPLIEARLRTTLGLSFSYLGVTEVATEQFLDARAIFIKHLGTDHPDTLLNSVNVANGYHALGRHAEALKLREETLALMKAKFGADHPDTMRSMNNLAISYTALDRDAEALKLREEALALRKAKLGPDHPDTLTSMNNLAVSYGALGRHAEALKLREETLALMKATLGPDHPDTMRGMSNLALSYSRLGRDAVALRLHEEALALRKAKLGPDHPDTLNSMNGLANTYSGLGRHAEALKLHEETLALRKAKLGPDHRDTLQSMNDLATSYAILGRHAEAAKLFEEALALRKAALGPDHPSTLRSMGNLAIIYYTLGRHAEALKLREETLALMKAKLGPDHPDTLQSMAGFADSLVRLGRGAEALPILDECVRRAAGKAVSPGLIPAIMNLRLRHFEKTKDAAGCRATAEMCENLNRADADSLYEAACMRAVTAAVIHATDKSPEAAKQAGAEADRAMAWLKKAIAAGYSNAAHMAKDTDLDALRDREDFKKLVAELEAVKEKDEKQ